MKHTVKEEKIDQMYRLGNSILNSAKYSSDNTDEWYTTYETIAEEVLHYKEQFKEKIVLCNCDDPYESNFCYYFLRHFNELNLRRLICTSYSGSKIDEIKDNVQLSLNLFDNLGEPISSKKGYVFVIDQMPGDIGEEVSDDVIKEVLKKKGTVKRLSGSGDFRTEECVKYMKECDICCTNPPFSLFSELFSLLTKYEKKYLLIGMVSGISLEGKDLLKIPSKRRNPILADIFSRLKYMERRGSGFKKILADYKGQVEFDETKMPVFEADNDDFILTLYNLNYGSSYATQANENVIENVIEISEEKIKKLMPEYSRKKLAKACEILKMISENPNISIDELRIALDVTDRTIARYISELKDKGIIERKGPDNGGEWIIR